MSVAHIIRTPMEDTKRAAQDHVQFNTSEDPSASATNSNIMITSGETLLASSPDREAPAAAAAAAVKANETTAAPTALMSRQGDAAAFPPPPDTLVVDPSTTASRRTNSDGAPRRFKSAFIIFSSMRHKQIKKELLEEGTAKKTTDIAKMVSQEWREMQPADKAVWEEKSSEDKERYEAEKARFKIQRPGKQGGKRILKDPDAPKRPMSAFLAFSNQRRAELKRKNPQATNADLSKMLSKQWKELDPEAKNKYVEEEAKLRKKYKGDIATWRRKKAAETKANRKKQEAAAVKAMQEREVREVVNRQGDGMGMQSAEQAGVGGAFFNQYGGGGAFSQLQAQSLSGARMGNPLFAGGQDMRGGLAGADALGAGNMFFSEQMARNAAAQQLLAQHLLGQQFLPQQAYFGNLNPLALQGQQPQNMQNQQQQGVFPTYMQQQQQHQQQQGGTGGSHDMDESTN